MSEHESLAPTRKLSRAQSDPPDDMVTPPHLAVTRPLQPRDELHQQDDSTDVTTLHPRVMAPTPQDVTPAPQPVAWWLATPTTALPDLPATPAINESPDASALASSALTGAGPSDGMEFTHAETLGNEPEDTPAGDVELVGNASMTDTVDKLSHAQVAPPNAAPDVATHSAALPNIATTSVTRDIPSELFNAGPINTQPDQTTLEEIDAMPTQWEYCRAQLDAGQYSQRQTDRLPYYIRVTVEYYGAETPQPLTFSEDTDQIDKPNRLWGRVLGQLGAAEWELVNVYLGGPKDFGILSAMAYFKRPVTPDRRVNEPRLALA